MNNQVLLSLLIIVTVSLNTLAQILLKAGSGKGLLNLCLLGGIVTYGLSTLIYIGLLGKLNLSLAYPLIIGLTVIATTMAGASLFHEKVEPIAWIGVGLMLSGIWTIAISRASV